MKCKIIHGENEKKISHCSDCGLCVLEWDHHCPWCSKCIAGGNIFFFYVFLFATIGVMLIFWFSMFAFMTRPEHSK
jgi:predicted amidophosphoribosyltransferase